MSLKEKVWNVLTSWRKKWLGTILSIPKDSQGRPARSCPICGNYWMYEKDSMGTAVCEKCGALLLNTPFRVEVLSKDARERFPEISDWDVEAWEVES